MAVVLLFGLIVIFIVCAIYSKTNPEQKPSTEVQPRHSFSAAEREAMRQAEQAFDWNTYNLIANKQYHGQLPEYDLGMWSSIYPDLYHTKIAGINFCRSAKRFEGMYFDAFLVLEPENTYDTEAIKIISKDEHRKLGYIPSDETSEVREWCKFQFPYPCRAHIDTFESWDEDTGRDINRLCGEINIKKNK